MAKDCINGSLKHCDRKIIYNLQIISLSSLIYNHPLFIKLIHDVYALTDFICTDYPKYFEWYWSKQIPRIFNGTGEIIVCTVDNNIAGVASLKKATSENKLCTLFVAEKYRGTNVTTNLLKCAFNYLGTSKPLITITEYKLSMFKAIIEKYHWKLVQVKDKSYYNGISREFVYNGTLPD